jgi:hypothetical protein
MAKNTSLCSDDNHIPYPVNRKVIHIWQQQRPRLTSDGFGSNLPHLTYHPDHPVNNKKLKFNKNTADISINKTEYYVSTVPVKTTLG